MLCKLRHLHDVVVNLSIQCRFLYKTDKLTVKVLRHCNCYGAKRLLKMIQTKPLTLGGLRTLIRKIDAVSVSSIERRLRIVVANIDVVEDLVLRQDNCTDYKLVLLLKMDTLNMYCDILSIFATMLLFLLLFSNNRLTLRHCANENSSFMQSEEQFLQCPLSWTRILKK